MELRAKKIIANKYGFCPNPSISPFQNSIMIRAHTPLTDCLTPPYIKNMNFHDLTDNKITPPEAKSVLGLGMKFIQTPKYTTSDLSTTLT